MPKVVDTLTLKRMCRNARSKGYNRLLATEVEARLDPDGKHVLTRPMLHGGPANSSVRCAMCLLKLVGLDEPACGALDFTPADWDAVPEYVEPAVAE